MKRILIAVLTFMLLLTGCVNNGETDVLQSPIPDVIIEEDTSEPIDTVGEGTEIESDVIIDITSDIKEEVTTKEVEIVEPIEINIPELPKFFISDIKLGGRDIDTYGEFDDEQIKELEKILDGYNKNISLAAYSLDGSKAIVYNGNQEYFSACTVKIPWMIYLCREIDAGRVDKDTILTYEEKHYHAGSGSIRKGSYGDQYTIEELIVLCLSISDNVAYEMLVKEVINREDFYKYINSLNMDRFLIPSYSIWCSNSIPTDFLIMWEDVYNYLKVETTGSKILKTACTNTIWNYGSATVKDYDYSHKSGDNFGKNPAHNDAGIIWADNPYVYAVFTNSEGTDYDEKIIDSAMNIVHSEFSK